MRCPRFTGDKLEDYDVRFSQVEAFFEVYKFTEEDNARIINAIVEGKPRK